MAWLPDWPIAGGDDIQSVLLTEDLYVGATERNHVTSEGLDGVVTGEYDDNGDDIQSATITILPVPGGDSLSVYSAIQSYAYANSINFIDNSVSYDQTGKPDMPWAGGNEWIYSYSSFLTRASLNANGFKRIYPKEIFDSTSTADVDGDSISNGDFAMATSDGMIYERVAGAWVMRGPPGGFRADRKVRYGWAETGDYINETPDFFNEMYRSLDALEWQILNPISAVSTSTSIIRCAENDSEANTGVGFGDETAGDTWATTKSEAETDYSSGGSGAVLGEGHYFFSAAFKGNATPNSEWWGYLEARRVKYEVNDDSALGALELSYTAELYTNVNDAIYSPAHSSNIDGTVTFDAHGTGYVQDDWKKIQTIGPSTADKVFSWLGKDPPVDVPTWVAEAADNNSPQGNSRGYRQGNGNSRTSYGGDAIIIKWDVAGGFSRS